MEDWCYSTSLNGVNELWMAKETKNKPKLIFWSIIMILMLTMTVLFSLCNIKSFIDSPTTTKISTIPYNNLEMPEIMLCYKGGVINKVNMLNNYGISPELANALALGITGKLDHVNYTALKNEYTNFLSNNNMTTAEFYNRVAALPCEEVIAYKSNAGNYNNNTKCLHVSTSVGSYGNPCLIFRQNGQQQYPGADDGVTIKVNNLNIENTHPIGVSTVTLTLEIKKEIQMPSRQFVEIPIHGKVLFLFSLTVYERLSKCWAENERFRSSTSCYHRCYQKSKVKHCNCSSIGWLTDDFDPDTCNILDYHLECYRYDDIVNKEAINCSHNCQPLCKEDSYYFTMTYFPVVNEESVTEISMIFREMMYTKIEEVESFTWDVAIANVGGQAGLWTGCTVITIVQGMFHLWIYLKKKQSERRKTYKLPVK